MRSAIQKYYIGLGVLGLLTLGLLIYVIIAGGLSRQDTITFKSANQVANKLNNYIEAKQKIPSDLSEAGVTDVPDTISYTKLSSSSYKFCMTFRSASGESVSNSVSQAVSSYQNASGGASYYPDYNDTQLYISSDYQKGENCKTVKPYIYDATGGGSCTYPYSDSSQQALNKYYDCLDKQYNTGSTPTLTN
jgi:hypothetical protein